MGRNDAIKIATESCFSNGACVAISSVLVTFPINIASGVAAEAARYGKIAPKSSIRYSVTQNIGPGNVRNLPVKIGSPEYSV